MVYGKKTSHSDNPRVYVWATFLLMPITDGIFHLQPYLPNFIDANDQKEGRLHWSVQWVLHCVLLAFSKRFP